MLVGELAGRIKVLPPPYTQPDPGLFLQITNIGSAGVQQGIYDLVLDPNFASNHFYYVFYTLGSPNHDRVSRFTANAALTGTVPGSEFVLYEDPQNADAEHHGGSLNFDNEGKLLFTTGEHFMPPALAAAHQPARQGPPDQPGRHDPDRQSVLRRIRPERRLDLGPRAAQPVSGLLRPAHRPLLHRRRRRQRRVHRRRGDQPRRRGRELRLAEQRGPLLVALPEPAVLLPAQRSRLRDHRRLRLPRLAVPQFVRRCLLLRRLHPELDQGSTTRCQRKRHRHLQLRAVRRQRRRPVRGHRLPGAGTGRRPVLPRSRLLRHRRHVRGEQAPADQVRALQPGAGRQRIGQSDLRRDAAQRLLLELGLVRSRRASR